MKPVIFDFNGTLFWDTEKHHEAWRVFAEKLCGRKLDEEELHRHVLGKTNELILDYLQPGKYTAAQADEIGREKEALYRELCLADPATFHLAEGAEELLDRLKAADYPIAIATSSDAENLQFYLEHFALSRWFPPEHIVYADGSFRGKPYPDIYLAAAKRLGVKPEDAVVLEDAAAGIKAARAAGVQTVIAVNSMHDRTLFDSVPGVSAVVDSLSEVPALLGL